MSLRKMFRKLGTQMTRCYLSLGTGCACPICGWSGHAFMRRAYANKPADTLLCPVCGSSERHRFAYLTLKSRLAAHAENTLHFAPEKSIAPWLKSMSKGYLSVDIASPTAMQKMDITDLRLPDGSFSLVWCSHVLEHIEDDRKALAELYRVLKPAGVAVIMVPIYGDKTIEDPGITTPEGRLKHFMQEDHVRLYGLDFKNRLAESGFSVAMIQTSDMPAESVEKYGLEYPSTKEIFLCTKPAGN